MPARKASKNSWALSSSVKASQVTCGSFPGTKPLSSQAAGRVADEKRRRYRSDAMRKRRLISDNVQGKPQISYELVEHSTNAVFDLPAQTVHELKIPHAVLHV